MLTNVSNQLTTYTDWWIREGLPGVDIWNIILPKVGARVGWTNLWNFLISPCAYKNMYSIPWRNQVISWYCLRLQQIKTQVTLFIIFQCLISKLKIFFYIEFFFQKEKVNSIHEKYLISIFFSFAFMQFYVWIPHIIKKNMKTLLWYSIQMQFKYTELRGHFSHA